MKFNFSIKSIKDTLSFYWWVLILLGLIFFLINIGSYFDPLNLCYIRIEGDVVRGEEATIHKALKLIKRENKKTYKDICKYVDVISEKNCIIADWQISGDEYAEGLELPGCYARGSKTIYIKPQKTISDETIEKRKNDIIKYSEFSKNFWTNQ